MGRLKPPRWANWPSERLLDLQLCELDVKLAGTWVEDLTQRVVAELKTRKISLKPRFWLSDEWFSPDGVPGVAVPFYVAQPRLVRLERQQMLEAEGSSRGECAKLLRHEIGHAVQTAYHLSRRRGFTSLFGTPGSRYPQWYRPNPRSRRFVQHLDGWYAQSHPAEDFAETFAVWLRPRTYWRKRYAGWPAMEKLEYVDALMGSIAGEKPKVTSRETPYSLPTLRRTLRTHYQRKREHYTVGFADTYDDALLELFSQKPRRPGQETAAAFLRRHRREIRDLVARWTGQYRYPLDQVLKEMIGRCRELRLRRVCSERESMANFAVLLTAHTMQRIYLGSGWHAM